MDVLDPKDPEARPLLIDWLSLQRAYALAPQAFPDALREHGLAALPRTAFSRTVPRIPVAEADRLIRVLVQRDAVMLPIASPLYPPRLFRLPDAPPVLIVRGNPALLRARCVAIVGARAATSGGLQMAFELAETLSRAGLVVVSGLARGIDAAAHRGALPAAGARSPSGATIAFLASGPDRTYPPEHARLADDVAAHGAVVTEFAIGSPPRAPYFPLRNRLISALSEAVIVVEARIRSGSLTTARHAANQGVDVFAVPGPPGQPTSEGPLELLREGAGLAACAADVLGALGLPVPAPKRVRTPRTGSTPTVRPELSARILGSLEREPSDLDGLAASLDVATAALCAALVALELAGEIALDRDGRYRRVRASGTAPAQSSPEGKRL